MSEKSRYRMSKEYLARKAELCGFTPREAWERCRGCKATFYPSNTGTIVYCLPCVEKLESCE